MNKYRIVQMETGEYIVEIYRNILGIHFWAQVNSKRLRTPIGSLGVAGNTRFTELKHAKNWLNSLKNKDKYNINQNKIKRIINV